jgi:hypothetical protein
LSAWEEKWKGKRLAIGAASKTSFKVQLVETQSSEAAEQPGGEQNEGNEPATKG